MNLALKTPPEAEIEAAPSKPALAAVPAAAALELKNVCKGYGSGANRSEILKNLNLRVEPGECVALLGPSGCGKSTILRLIAGLDQPDGGRILLFGRRAHGVC